MKRNLQYFRNSVRVLQLTFLAITLFFLENSLAQTYNVEGVISTSTSTVRSASVTFIDNSDTTIQFQTVTDAFGYYAIDVVTSVSSINKQPINFDLEQNYPNPFSSTTAISYRLKEQSDVLITIYDILGREIKKFTVGVQSGGVHGVVWDGRNNFGEKTAMGIYFYRLQAGGETQVKKMIYGVGDSKLNISISKLLSYSSSGTNNKLSANLLGDNFTVRVKNTVDTYPLITPRQINNIIIQSDTTLNFSVFDASTVTVYLDNTQQVISGFGAANIVPWRPDMTTDEINKAFGTGDGQIGFSLLRLRVPWNQNEFSLNVSTALAAQNMGVDIIASPWTAPPGMKTNNNIVGGRLSDASYAEYAAHLKSFSDYLSANGVQLSAISVQNEPDVNVSYESMDWNADEMLRFMKENAPSIGIDVFVAESFNFNHTITDAILNDSVATENTAFIGGHIYGGGLEPYPLANDKGKEIWMTEHLVLETEWADNLATGKEIHDCMNAGMSAYIWWYIVRFYGPIYDDGSHPDTPPGAVPGEISKRGYVMSQFARFIRPGYYRVTASGNPQPGVYVTAYKNDQKVVIVAINLGSQPIDQTFAIQNGNVVSVTPYVTSSSKNAVQESNISVSNSIFTTTLDGSSVTTFVSE